MKMALAGALALVTLLPTLGQATSTFNKCVDAEGNVTYNDTPCAAHEDTSVLSKTARELEVLDCRIANNFAFDAVARMRQDDSAVDVLNAYGGASMVSEDARELIEHVFTFKSNSKMSSQAIVDSTIEQCESGSLGNSLEQCDAFPSAFIERIGGCVDARESLSTALLQPALPTSSTAPSNRANTVSGLNEARALAARDSALARRGRGEPE